ncbi:MAG: hypothetical protein IK093_17310 [Ruminiclostridium sp.]|nr:hypothetical protein [Ruminiclostridium sp.]
MTLEEFRKKLDGDEAFRAEVEAKAKALKELNPDKSDPEIDRMFSAEYGVEISSGKEINDDDMDAVAGGVLFAGELATDGHELNCILTFYWGKANASWRTRVCQDCKVNLERTDWLTSDRFLCPKCNTLYWWLASAKKS